MRSWEDQRTIDSPLPPKKRARPPIEAQEFFGKDTLPSEVLSDFPPLPFGPSKTPKNGDQYLDVPNGKLWVYANGWRFVTLAT